jgi:hypothetical protein
MVLNLFDDQSGCVFAILARKRKNVYFVCREMINAHTSSKVSLRCASKPICNSSQCCNNRWCSFCLDPAALTPQTSQPARKDPIKESLFKSIPPTEMAEWLGTKRKTKSLVTCTLVLPLVRSCCCCPPCEKAPLAPVSRRHWQRKPEGLRETIVPLKILKASNGKELFLIKNGPCNPITLLLAPVKPKCHLVWKLWMRKLCHAELLQRTCKRRLGSSRCVGRHGGKSVILSKLGSLG